MQLFLFLQLMEVSFSISSSFPAAWIKLCILECSVFSNCVLSLVCDSTQGWNFKTGALEEAAMCFVFLIQDKTRFFVSNIYFSIVYE